MNRSHKTAIAFLAGISVVTVLAVGRADLRPEDVPQPTDSPVVARHQDEHVQREGLGWQRGEVSL